MLPELVKPGDLVFIDGPKHHRALRLAFALLNHQKPAAVFIHDCYEGSCERDFLKSGVPGVFFSDDPRFVERVWHLDEKCWALREKLSTDEFRVPYVSHGKPSSYGPTLACIPANPGLNFPRLKVRLFFCHLRPLLRAIPRPRRPNRRIEPSRHEYDRPNSHRQTGGHAAARRLPGALPPDFLCHPSSTNPKDEGHARGEVVAAMQRYMELLRLGPVDATVSILHRRCRIPRAGNAIAPRTRGHPVLPRAPVQPGGGRIGIH